MSTFRPSVVRRLEAAQAKLTPLSTEVFGHLDEEFLALANRVAYDHAKLQAMGQAHPQCQRLQAIPGVGPPTATAILAAVPDATHVKNGRQLAAWLGLGPREHATGGKPRRLGISKRGDRYLRKLLAHGAQATRRWAVLKNDPRSQWGRALIARRGNNGAAVA
jgi:transposase